MERLVVGVRTITKEKKSNILNIGYDVTNTMFKIYQYVMDPNKMAWRPSS